EEDGCGGQGQPANPLPEELARAQSRLKRLGEAKRELEEEERQRLEEAQRAWTSRGKQGRPQKGEEPRRSAKECRKQRKRYYRARHNAACPKRKQNLTDPAFRHMHDNARGCIVQGYIEQLVVDAEAQVIVAAEVPQQVLDRGQLLAMMESTVRNTGQGPDVVTADAGYWDTEALHWAAVNLPCGSPIIHPGPKSRLSAR